MPAFRAKLISLLVAPIALLTSLLRVGLRRHPASRARLGRRAVAAASALLAVASLALAAQAPASAVTTSARATRTAAARPHITTAARPRIPAAASRTARAAPSGRASEVHQSTAKSPAAKAAALPRDVRRVCAAPKRGYAACMSLLRTNVKSHKGLFAAGSTPSGYGPSDLQSAYDLPSAKAGSGQTVAIVDAYNDPDAEANLQVYRAQYGLPVCDTANGCFEQVNQNGKPSPLPPNAGSNGWDVEESLDIDMVSAICPNCRIILVEADNSGVKDLGTAVDAAVALGAKYVSNSYGTASEVSGETSYDRYYNHPGVAITAAAGDDGYGVEYPAASQYVTSVGGTTLTQDSGVPRGWAETVWGSASGGEGTGSGCSAYETKPAWQRDTGCAKRTVADVSAVANPSTGVALYDSYSQGGWIVVGGTSVATPVIASTYALAGTPAAGTYPSSYPYADPSALNDVISGANGTCSPAYLCTAGPGYDGPTGLGTPDGVAAFTPAFYGTLTGTVTDAKTGQPVSGATVSVDGFSVTTDGSGGYTAAVPVGSYTVTASDWDYATQNATGVQVSRGQTTMENFALVPAQEVTLSGAVKDGSGHGWPLSATVSVPGDPAPAYTNPVTGRYRLSVPDQATYTVSVAAVGTGYQQAQQQVTIGTTSAKHNFTLPVDASTCDATGYKFTYQGATQDFNGTTAPHGWTVTNAPGTTAGWVFDDPLALGNQTGGTGNFAAAEPGVRDVNEKTELTSPVMNLSKDASPILQFDTASSGTLFPGVGDADLSVNGGKSWTAVWQWPTAPLGPDQVVVALPQAAGKAQVQVRFYFASTGVGTGDNQWWQLDDVFLGSRSCGPVPGGLVEGTVTDANTGRALEDATITSVSHPAQTSATGLVPRPGSYQLFASPAGTQSFTVTAPYYATVTKSVNVAANKITQENVALPAGQLALTPGSLNATERMGAVKTGKVTVTNTGTAPATVRLTAQPGGFTLAGQPASRMTVPPAAGARLQLIEGHYHLLPGPSGQHAGIAGPQARPAAGTSSWTTGADYPVPVEGNAVAADPGSGGVYSVGGDTGGQLTEAAYVYNPYASKWARLPHVPVARQEAAAAFTGGKLYVAGGWDSAGVPQPQLKIYNPATRTWSAGASEPAATAASSVAVLDGDIYVIGGCGVNGCSSTSVQVYDPSSNTWSSAAAYPEPIAYAACGAIRGKIYCAGGSTGTLAGTTLGYSYNPVTNRWSPIPSLPTDLWGMGYSASGGRLLISGGVTGLGTELTNQGFAYTPRTGWSTLPDSPDATYRSGSACGFYQVGGYNADSAPTSSTQVLPGYDDCASGSRVPWLTERPATTTLAPGASTTITVALNAADSAVTQPGTYTATLAVVNSTPYQITGNPVTVTLTVTPPRTWGEITGTVTGQGCDGTDTLLAGATVEVTGVTGTWALTTVPGGQYALWLDRDQSPVTLIAADPGWQTKTAKARITAGKVTTDNLTLSPDGGCSQQDTTRNA